MRKNRYGFTLVEMAIVMIIISLVTIGVFSGKDLIISTKRNALLSESMRIKSAYTTFRLQYNAVPGDMKDAWDYWGTQCAWIDTVCNGNGDSRLWIDDEPALLWKHLALTKIMPKDEANACAFCVTQRSKISEIVHYFIQWESYYFTDRWRSNTLILFNAMLGEREIESPVISGKEAYMMDLKADDGKAYTGQVVGAGQWADWGAPSLNNACRNANEYKREKTEGLDCVLIFVLDYT